MSEISSTEKPIGVIDAQRLHDTFNDEFDTEYDRRAKTYQRLVDRVKELEQQRDAALTLADEWCQCATRFRRQHWGWIQELPADISSPSATYDSCADDIRAIFDPKDEK